MISFTPIIQFINLLKATMRTLLTLPQGAVTLSRNPTKVHKNLQAWDAADEYLLEEIFAKESHFARTLIVNDSFGALSCFLSKFGTISEIDIISHSFISLQAIKYNFDTNKICAEETLSKINKVSDSYDLVVLKIQKSLAQLEDQLHNIRPHINEDTLIVAGGMTKFVHNSTLSLFEKILGPTHTSLAKKKSRLIFCTFDKHLNAKINPYPSSYMLPNTPFELLSHAGVFAQEKIDQGARLLIEHLPKKQCYSCVIDLACGNGVLGITMALNNQCDYFYFSDESFQATKSAQENFTAILGASGNAEFVSDDCLSQYLDKHQQGTADIVLNNPPFHQQNTIDYTLALKMFQHSKLALKRGGELWVVGNTHLQYQKKLMAIFGNCEYIAGNKKFTILKAMKR